MGKTTSTESELHFTTLETRCLLFSSHFAPGQRLTLAAICFFLLLQKLIQGCSLLFVWTFSSHRIFLLIICPTHVLMKSSGMTPADRSWHRLTGHDYSDPLVLVAGCNILLTELNLSFILKTVFILTDSLPNCGTQLMESQASSPRVTRLNSFPQSPDHKALVLVGLWPLPHIIKEFYDNNSLPSHLITSDQQ